MHKINNLITYMKFHIYLDPDFQLLWELHRDSMQTLDNYISNLQKELQEEK